MDENLIDTIKEDCLYYQKAVNKDRLFDYYLYLNECRNSKDNGLYQLIFNGFELWYGTLKEINAVVKSMIAQVTRPEDYNLA